MNKILFNGIEYPFIVIKVAGKKLWVATISLRNTLCTELGISTPDIKKHGDSSLNTASLLHAAQFEATLNTATTKSFNQTAQDIYKCINFYVPDDMIAKSEYDIRNYVINEMDDDSVMFFVADTQWNKEKAIAYATEHGLAYKIKKTFSGNGDILFIEVRYEACVVSIEEDPTYPAYRRLMKDWNGWEVPYFTKETMIQIVNDYNKQLPADTGASFKYDEVADEVTWISDGDEPDDAEVVQPQIIYVNGEQLTVYCLGLGWVWSLCYITQGFIVLQVLINGQVQPVFRGDEDKLTVYDTENNANAAIFEAITDINHEVITGNMSKDSKVSYDDYIVIPVTVRDERIICTYEGDTYEMYLDDDDWKLIEPKILTDKTIV